MSRRLQRLINTGYNGYELAPSFGGFYDSGEQVDLSTASPVSYPTWGVAQPATQGNVESTAAGKSSSGFDFNSFAKTASDIVGIAGPLLSQILNAGKNAELAAQKAKTAEVQGASASELAALQFQAEQAKAQAQALLDAQNKSKYLMIAGGVGAALLVLGFLATRR